MVCGPPPEGISRWSIRVTAEEAVKRKIVPHVGRETVRVLLISHDLKPWRKKMWCIPEVNSEFLEDYKAFATTVRAHWEIENKLHWVLDVAFHEDRSTIHKQNTMRNVALVRRLAFNLLKALPTQRKISVAIKRKKAGWDSTLLHDALIGN